MAHWPLSITAPLVAASAAYLNAKFDVNADLSTIWIAISTGTRAARLEKNDRVNMFYRLEDFANNPKFASKPFIVVPPEEAQSGKTEWTFAEVYDTVLRYARWFKEEHGVQKREIIAMDFKNKPQFIFIWWALWSLGAQPAFINTNLRDKGFAHCVKISSARLLVVDPELEEVLTDEVRAELSPDTKGRAIEAIVLEPALEEHISRLEAYRAPDEVRSGAKIKDPAILIYTSGTTGLPKAANVNWGKPHSGPVFWYRLMALKPNDRVFTAMPLYHSSASVIGLNTAFGGAGAIVISSKFSPRNFMRQAHDTKATVIQYVGEMCRYLVSSPPTQYDTAHSIRLAFGNGMRPDVWQRFKDRFAIPDICEFYGATEAPGVTYVYSRNSYYRGAVGRSGLLVRTLFRGNQVLVKHDHETEAPWRDPATGSCVRVPDGDVGELLIWLDPATVPDKYHGYFGNEKASQSKLLQDVFKKGDIYYRTGDLQRRDADGKWWFVDRIGDTFRWKGENVSTAEVAETLGAHPVLSEVNVYGIEIPNHDGRAGCAAIGLANGASMSDALAAELASHLRERLPRYAVPLFLRVQKQLEVTGNLKYQKVTLRNEGVNPGKTGADELYWLAPGAERYSRFDKAEWERLVGGSAKL